MNDRTPRNAGNEVTDQDNMEVTEEQEMEEVITDAEDLGPSDMELKLREEVKKYYREYFEIDELWKLIDKNSFPTREFGFIRMDKRGMVRNKSFEKPQHLLEYLSLFPVEHAYVGAVYEDRVMPAIKYMPGTSIDQTEWLGRELTFDLDLTDYDPVRPCECRKREFCKICWSLMQDAAQIITDTLREDFGFEEIIWLFSGGRGYHAWVLDDITFNLTEPQRKSIVGYLQLIYTTVNYEKIEDIGDQAISLRHRIYQHLVRDYILDTSESDLIEIKGIGKKTVSQAKSRLENSALVKDIVDVIPKNAIPNLLDTVIKNRYPRLDAAVTEGHNHLIRLPGGIHMGTGFITQVVPNPTQFNPITDATHLYDILGKERPERWREE